MNLSHFRALTWEKFNLYNQVIQNLDLSFLPWKVISLKAESPIYPNDNGPDLFGGAAELYFVAIVRLRVRPPEGFWEHRDEFQDFTFTRTEAVLNIEYTEQYVLKRVHSFLKFVILHELDENLMYKGKRVFDPHKPTEESPIRRVDDFR